MEEFVVEFECCKEEDPNLDHWFKELDLKLDAMKEFKKRYQKYNLGLDTFLKKVGAFDQKCADAHAKFTS